MGSEPLVLLFFSPSRFPVNSVCYCFSVLGAGYHVCSLKFEFETFSDPKIGAAIHHTFIIGLIGDLSGGFPQKWHPDKHKGDNAATAKFQEINEAYTVLSDPSKRLDYDLTGNCEIDKYTLREYLSRFKGMILTCNGLGIAHTSIWSWQLMETNEYMDK
ncbi:uncharacterized protein LOC122081655 [Macadamia integrifolia]|uniref:uncharacterized protein LOC122081655 n=1 Tax=Macadamia integrifolia TaxID=60698 RepID=UPI001C4FA30F|nr:uncharacterized protein LOC122081655 [Macadamia integrifolia]